MNSSVSDALIIFDYNYSKSFRFIPKMIEGNGIRPLVDHIDFPGKNGSIRSVRINNKDLEKGKS